MRNRFIDTLIASNTESSNILFISGDAGLGVFDKLCTETPESFINMGVAEQNMASFAAGLALTGQRVVMYNIIPFLLYRCYEQVRNDICYQRLPVIMAGIGSGITYAPQGMTHYSVEDLGIAATLPNLTVISPCDAAEARGAAAYALAANGPVYVRLAKHGELAIHDSEFVDVKEPLLIRGGTDCALLFYGSIADEAVAAAGLLEQQGIRVALISVPLLQPLPEERLLTMLATVPLVVSLEEQYERTGLGGMLAALKVRENPSWRLQTLGIPHRFIHEIYDCKGLRHRFGLDAGQVYTQVRRWLADGR